MLTCRLSLSTVLHYFFGSPFFDRASNNGSLIMQAQVNPALLHVVNNRQIFEQRLKTMVGTEFAITAEDPANGVWVIKKQLRRSPVEVVPLDVYFIVGENVYQAPTLHGIMTSRLVCELRNSFISFWVSVEADYDCLR